MTDVSRYTMKIDSSYFKVRKKIYPVLEFYENYKKLHCGSQQIFTTIRKEDKENFANYNLREGEVFNVKIEGKSAFKALLILALTYDAVRYIPSPLLDYDTGEHWEELFRGFGEHRVLLLIFQRLREVA